MDTMFDMLAQRRRNAVAFEPFLRAVFAMADADRPALLAELGADEVESLLETALIGPNLAARDQVTARWIEVAPSYSAGSAAAIRRRVEDQLEAARQHGEDYVTVKHARWTTVLHGRPEERGSMDEWVGVSLATLHDFAIGLVHGRRVTAQDHCVPDCPGCPSPAQDEDKPHDDGETVEPVEHHTCPRGHGPLVERPAVHAHDAYVGRWLACHASGCGYQLVEPTGAFLAHLDAEAAADAFIAAEREALANATVRRGCLTLIANNG